MADETRTFEHIELGASYELGMRRGVAERETNGRVGAGARVDGLRRSGDELDIQQPPVSAADAELWAIRYRPLRAQVEGSAPTSLIDWK
jgi:hypothetical protein